MRVVPFVALVLLSACASRPPSQSPSHDLASPFVGIRFPPLPQDFDAPNGFMIGQHFSVSQVQGRGLHMLWLDSLTHHEPVNERVGEAHWVVLSVVRIPALARGETVVWHECRLNGRMDSTVVALGQWRKPAADSLLAKMRGAWRVDLEHKRFEILPLSSVRCVRPL